MDFIVSEVGRWSWDTFWLSHNQFLLGLETSKEKEVPVFKKLLEGSRPAMQQPAHIINRPEIINDIASRLLYYHLLHITNT